jgi:signal transduction histidine kinase
VRRAFDAACRAGDLTFAAYSCNNLNTNLLAAGDPLADVHKEAENGLEFARKARFGLVIDIITAQLGLIRTLRGRTPEFGSFDDDEFDEKRFEHHLQSDSRLALPECWYWIRKLQARVYADDCVCAIEAASKAQQLLWTSPSFFEVAEYHFYDALARAARCDVASAGERGEHLEALAAHHKQLEVWEANCPENFANREALVAAEIARLEGRDLDAMRLYDQAIQSAREHGFVQNEGLAHEAAARFCLTRGIETVGRDYLRNARSCYERWGALGKVKQLDARHPYLREGQTPASPAATIGAPVGQLDVETVVKASQALSSEIVLPRLIEKLMRIAVEHAGAERGLLVLLRGDEPQIEAEATTGHGRIEVTVRQAAVTPSDLPQSALHYVIRTRERVILEDALVGNLYSGDEYVRHKRARSVLCLPIVKQTKLVGALYLENNLTPRAFTADRVAVLELLASQAAISLENARLYSELQRSETFLSEGQSISSTGSFGLNVLTGEIYWSEETYRIFECDPAATPTLELVLRRAHPDDRVFVQETLGRASREGANFDFEFRLLMPDSSVKHLHALARALKPSSGNLEFVGTVIDITERKLAEAERARLEQRLRQAEKMEAVGQFAGGIAHDFNNVLSGILGYGETLVEEAPEASPLRRYAQNVLKAANRGRALVEQILVYSRSQRGKRTPVDIVGVMAETLELVRGSLPANIRLDLSAPQSPLVVFGDPTRLHQVVMNLCSNAIQAMSGGGALRVALEAEDLSAGRALSHGALGPGRYARLTVEDHGSGMDDATLSRIFEPFFTTKEVGRGTGLGLSIVFAIVTDSGGAIDVKSVVEQGSTFAIYLPLVK